MYAKPHQRLFDALFGTQRYGREFWAVRSATFEVRVGETLGIIGRNGAGKSTLLQMISGVLASTTGSLAVTGKVAALLELGAGFNPEFTGRENARLNAAIMGLSAQEINARLDDMIAFSELGDFIDRPVKTYSSGMYVRLAFSVAIHVSPAVLVIDEALAVGDARFQAKCMRRIKWLKQEGVTILFVSHDVAAVRKLCDRALWLDQGSIRMLGDVMTVTARYNEFLFDSADEQPALPTMHTEAPAQRPEQTHPLVRWGTTVGSIIEATLHDGRGAKREIFNDNEIVEVRIRFRLPDGADRACTGIAFSIKDVAGSDLVVYATLDELPQLVLPESGDLLELRCGFDNCLASGDYYLAVALEDRQGGSIGYFDYIEGAEYFSISFQRVIHGRFVPAIRHATIKAAAEIQESV